MATLDLNKLSKEEQIFYRMQIYGVGKVEATFITGIESGEIDGDILEATEEEAEAIKAGLFDDDTRMILRPDQVPDE